MRPKSIYLVVEAKPDGIDLFEGTAEEVAEFVKVHPTQVRRASRRGSLVRSRYHIEPKDAEPEVWPTSRRVGLYMAIDNKTGATISGADYELAEQLGVTVQAIRQAYTSGYYLKGRYFIYEHTKVR